MKRVRFVLWGLVFAIAPTCIALRPAFADDDGENDAEADPSQPPPPHAAGKTRTVDPRSLVVRRAALLGAISSDAAALINVTAEELPATPDVYNLGRKTTAALARCLADNVDDRARAACAEMLGKMGDRSALPALTGALEAWDPNVRHSAIVALAGVPDAASIDPLVKIVGRQDEDTNNVAAALRTLGALSHSRAAASLRHAFSTMPAHRLVALRGIFRSRSVLSRDAVVEDVRTALQTKDDDSLVLEALRMAAHLRASEHVSALEALISHGNVQIRNRAVYVLGKVGDRRATAVLVAHAPKVRESRMLNNIAFALERLDAPQFFRTIEPLAKHKQASIRLNASFVLGEVGRKEGVAILATPLRDENAAVRTTAVMALGHIDAKESADTLEPFTQDADPKIREEARFGLFHLSGAKRTDLLVPEYLASPAPAQHARAVVALGGVGDERVLDDALAMGFSTRAFDTLFRTKRPDVVGPRALIRWAQGDGAAEKYVAALKPDGSASLVAAATAQALAQGNTGAAISAVHLLADLGDARHLARVEGLESHARTMSRMEGYVSAVRLGKVTDAASFWTEWDNLPRARLAMAATMLARVQEGAARTAFAATLAKKAASNDRLEAALAKRVQFAWNAEDGMRELVESLRSPSSEERETAVRALANDDRDLVTSLVRKALARESVPVVKDALAAIADARSERFRPR